LGALAHIPCTAGGEGAGQSAKMENGRIPPHVRRMPVQRFDPVLTGLTSREGSRPAPLPEALGLSAQSCQSRAAAGNGGGARSLCRLGIDARRGQRVGILQRRCRA
jgi:hypothetical protein